MTDSHNSHLYHGKADIVFGLQVGDEGKGKNITQFLRGKFRRKYTATVRPQGGDNAGHTLVDGDRKHVGHIIPSGLFMGIDAFIGHGAVVNPVSLMKEIHELENLGININGKLFISNRATVVSSFHPILDSLEEKLKRKNGNSIGTTGRGIGPAYADTRKRISYKVGDLDMNDLNYLRETVEKLEHTHLSQLYGLCPLVGLELESLNISDIKDVWSRALAEYFDYVKDGRIIVTDVASVLIDRLNRDENILIEGAQGARLDIDLGNYPNVTSSNTFPLSLMANAGIPHQYIGEVYGVIKAYETKVGNGGFPSRIKDEAVESSFRIRGEEYGSTTKRPREIGWLDMVALCHMVKLSGVKKIILNKADIMPVPEISFAWRYFKNGIPLSEFPLHLENIDVELKTFKAWEPESIAHIRDPEMLPLEFLRYLDAIKEEFIRNDLSDVRIIAVGTGPDAQDMVYF